MLASDGLDLTCTTDTGITLYNKEQMLTLLTPSRTRKRMVFHFGCCMFCWWFVHTIFVSRFYLQQEKKIMKKESDLNMYADCTKICLYNPSGFPLNVN